MKAELLSWDAKTFGVELTAENEEEDKALRRLDEGGVKINAITPRRDNNSSLQLTFADLIGESKREILDLLKPSQDVPRYDSVGIPIDYTYTPCFGTHGNRGVPIGRCPKCGQLVYETSL